jgi:hypothetical protein
MHHCPLVGQLYLGHSALHFVEKMAMKQHILCLLYLFVQCVANREQRFGGSKRVGGVPTTVLSKGLILEVSEVEAELIVCEVEINLKDIKPVLSLFLDDWQRRRGEVTVESERQCCIILQNW